MIDKLETERSQGDSQSCWGGRGAVETVSAEASRITTADNDIGRFIISISIQSYNTSCTVRDKTSTSTHVACCSS